MFGPTTYPSPVASLIPSELRKNHQNTVTAMDRTIPSVRRYSASYSRSSSPFRGYSALMSRNPGRKKRSTSAPITRAVATTAPRTSSDNVRPSGPSIFEDCALDISEERLRTTRAYIRPRRPYHDSESRQDVRARLRRCARRRGPGGIRRPRERCARDDEVLADL